MHTDNRFWDAVQCNVIEIGQEDALPARGFLPSLGQNSIHVWSARYEDLDRHFRDLSEVISRKEQETASTFRTSADAKKYTLRRGIVRNILAHYTHNTPEMVSFSTGKNGKPELDPDRASAEVSFNLSHTGEMVLIGVTRKRRIGVDIVKIDPSYRFRETAEYMLTPGEKAFLKSIEPALRQGVFFRIWAIKEAILKATGSTLALMETTDLSEIIEDLLRSPKYSMKYLDAHPPFFIGQFTSGSGHHGAIAVESDNSLQISGTG
jgi:4'-phosphopantetheinyl transferase